jgi:hypothetical protein
MAITNTRLTTTSNQTVYTSSGTNAIVTIIICNTGTPNATNESVDACLLDLYVVASGDSPDLSSKVTPFDGNAVVSQLLVPAGETIFFSDEKIVLETGDYVVAVASDSDLLSITVSTLAV